MVLKLFTTFIVVAAILASPKHMDFTWSYRSSVYRVHCTLLEDRKQFVCLRKHFRGNLDFFPSCDGCKMTSLFENPSLYGTNTVTIVYSTHLPTPTLVFTLGASTKL